MTPYTGDAPGLIQRIADLERQLAAVTAGADQWQINALQAREEADALEGQLAAEREARNSAEGANDALSRAIGDFLERWDKAQACIIGDEELVAKTHAFLREHKGSGE